MRIVALAMLICSVVMWSFGCGGVREVRRFLAALTVLCAIAFMLGFTIEVL